MSRNPFVGELRLVDAGMNKSLLPEILNENPQLQPQRQEDGRN